MSDDLFQVVGEANYYDGGELIVEWYEKRREVLIVPFNGNRDTAVVVEEVTTSGLEGENVEWRVTDHYARRLDGSVPLVNEWTFPDSLPAFTKAFEQAAWNAIVVPRYYD